MTENDTNPPANANPNAPPTSSEQPASPPTPVALPPIPGIPVVAPVAPAPVAPLPPVAQVPPSLFPTIPAPRPVAAQGSSLAGLGEAQLVDVYDKLRPSMPQIVVEKLNQFVTDHALETAEIRRFKATYAEVYAMPAIQAQGALAFQFAVNAAVAKFMGIMNSANFPYIAKILSAGRPIQKKKDEKKPNAPRGWFVKMSLLGRCAHKNQPFEGPANATVYDFADEASAMNYARSLVPGKLYEIPLHAPKDSGGNPTLGVMGVGQMGFLSGTGRERIKEYTGPDPWPSVAERIWKSIPLCPIRDALVNPKENATYGIEGDITEAFTGTSSGDGGEMSGRLSLRDDSVTGQVEKAFPTGITFYLPRGDAAKAILPAGSRVRAVISGYKAEKKDKTGAKTGNVGMNWNAIYVETVFDLSGGMEIPEPGRTAVSVPSGAPGVTRDVM